MMIHSVLLLLSLLTGSAFSFAPRSTARARTAFASRQTSPLFVSIGLGPEKQEEEAAPQEEVIDYEIPNHEEYRLVRRSKMDEQCDEWFGGLLGSEQGILGDLATQARSILTTPVALTNEFEKEDRNDPEWTPYVSTKLPWSPLYPAYGLEQYGLPVPRRNAETWRHFDVAGMIAHDYSGTVEGNGTPLELSSAEAADMKTNLEAKGAWLDDSEVDARLIYVDGRYVPQLSKTSSTARNLAGLDDDVSEEMKSYLSRLTDGFTDELAAPVHVEGMEEDLHLQSKLSGPNHSLGAATSQFAMNTQQGTACFAALNTIHTGAVAQVHATGAVDKPIAIVHAVTKSGGADSSSTAGVASHPRTLLVAEKGSVVSLIQQCVDLDDDVAAYKPKLYNGYTQVFVKGGANVTHSYVDESGGMVTQGTEQNMDEPRQAEAVRPELSDTHLEAMDVHLMGEDAAYEGTAMCMGGSGHIRVGMSVSLLATGAHATVNGFSLSGGAQRSDMKTNLHHVAQGTTSRQVQKNMIGGRATGSFRGRVRVEQTAQQTDSEQLSRTILLSDKSRAWAVPSLEIIADDVKCTHGATVSDLSEEELFYLRSRGLNRALSRNLLMYAFACDVSNCVDPVMLGSVVESQTGLQKRVIQRLENLVPQGERAVKGEFQSI